MQAGEAQPDRSPGEKPGGEPPDGAQRPMSDDELKAIRQMVIGDDPDARRFSLWGLLGIVTGASLVLAVGSYFPKPIFAGAVGIATLVTMVALSAMKHPPAVLQVAWWTLLLIYLMAIGSAIMG
jgi:hypothetical protein